MINNSKLTKTIMRCLRIVRLEVKNNLQQVTNKMQLKEIDVEIPKFFKSIIYRIVHGAGTCQPKQFAYDLHTEKRKSIPNIKNLNALSRRFVRTTGIIYVK
jgi:hypothetical protein